MKQSICIEALYTSLGHNYFGRHGKESLSHEMISQQSIRCIAGRGIEGDRFFDFKENYKGQITFFDAAVWHRLERELEVNVKGADFRRNVLVSGIDLNSLIKKRFRIHSILFEGVEECRPCYWMDEACGPGAEDVLKGYGGLRARILSDGKMERGQCEIDLAV